jgi:hypothetical protein
LDAGTNYCAWRGITRKREGRPSRVALHFRETSQLTYFFFFFAVFFFAAGFLAFAFFFVAIVYFPI